MLRVQELDLEIARLNRELKDAAAQLEQIAADRKKRSAYLQKLEQECAALSVRRRSLEADLKTREQQHAKFEKQATAVKTPKELEAVNHQLEGCAGEISKLEEQILAVMEDEEKRTSELAEKHGQAEKMEARARELETRLTDAGAEKTQLLSGLGEDRIVAANQLPEELRSTYEYLHKKFGPTAVTDVRTQACGGCGGVLVPSIIMHAKQGNELVQCTHCLRYLNA